MRWLVLVLCACSAHRVQPRRGIAPVGPRPQACAPADRMVPLDTLDPALRLAILLAARVPDGGMERPGPVRETASCAELAQISVLEIDRPSSLHGIELVPNLNELTLVDVGDGDLSPIAALPLRKLSIGSFEQSRDGGPRTSIRDFSPLVSLTRLEELTIIASGLHDLAPLAPLVRLRLLALPFNDVTDLTPLAGLAQLEEVRLDWNRIADASTLGGLHAIRHLDISQNPLASVAGWAGLAHAEEIVLGGTNVEDLAPLVDLPLRTLWACGTPAIEERRHREANRRTITALGKRGVNVPTGSACRH